MNCIIVDDEEMSRAALKHLAGQSPFLNLLGECGSSAEALAVLNEQKVDLMLLDVKMPEMDGLELIKTLQHPPLIILITAKKEYAIEAFECNVVDYILKPVSLARFLKAITKAKSLFEAGQQKEDVRDADHLFIKTNASLIKLSIKEILWIEALGDYIKVHTADKSLTIHSTMKGIEKKLPPDIFIRVHRSFIVSIFSINSIDDATIVTDKKLIPVGAMYKENLMKRLNLL
jgi:two-component system, LytTR family, response regulator